MRLGVSVGRGPALGAHLEGGAALVLDPFTVGLRLGVDATRASVGVGAASVWLPLVGARACAGFFRRAVDVCAIVDGGAAVSFGSGVADAKVGVAPVISPGGAIDFVLPVVHDVDVVVGAEVSVPLVRVQLRDSTTRASIYEQPPVNGLVTAGVRLPL